MGKVQRVFHRENGVWILESLEVRLGEFQKKRREKFGFSFGGIYWRFGGKLKIKLTYSINLLYYYNHNVCLCSYACLLNIFI